MLHADHYNYNDGDGFQVTSTATTDDFLDIVHFMHTAVQPLLLPVCLILIICDDFTHATDTIQG